MAVDTRNRRASALGIAYPDPDGSLANAGDRSQLGDTYPIGAVAPGGPGAFTFAGLLERLGGAKAHMLFDLSVTHPTPKTWTLSTPDVTGPGGVSYWGIVREYAGVSASAALGGLGGEGGVTLTLTNSTTSGITIGRRFMDAFATPVPGYSEPYDLLTATLQCRVVFEELLTEPLTVGRSLALQPAGFEWSVAPGEPERVTLTFGADTRRYKQLPTAILTDKRYAHLPDSMDGRPLPVWFGTDVRVPLLPLDGDGGLYGIGSSPTATPLGGLTKLWTVRPDLTVAGSDADQLVALPVRITTGGEVVLSVAGNSTAVDLTQIAQLVEMENTGAFVYAVRLWLRRKASGTPAQGAITVALHLDADGLPGDTLIDPAATAQIDASIVGTGVPFLPFDVPFQAQADTRAAFAFAGRFWVVTKHARDAGAGGALQMEIDATGAYTKGYMAKRATATDEAWVAVGKHVRRGPVRKDFTGIGYLFRNATTSGVAVLPPAKT